MSDSKINSFDIGALEKAVNDSATRISTIWVSFLLFGLYLVVAASAITQRQIFLAEPVKLPVLNIDLPLQGFFFLAPILFTIFHGYVMLQLLLLGRTAAAYNKAVLTADLTMEENESLRQRLANTLFAQIFAGSGREREGALGWIMRFITWLTLVAGPVSVLAVFEISFLPYHSHLITWLHRFLIAFDLLIVLMLWPAALDAQRDIKWRALLRQPIALPVAVMITLTAWLLPTFPGEPHADWTRYNRPDMRTDMRDPRELPAPDACNRRSILHTVLSEHFDRLSRPRQIFVDEIQIAKSEKDATDKGLLLHQAPRSRDFSARDLTCADLRDTDLRLANFSNIIAEKAIFDRAELKGALFDKARMPGASFNYAQLRGVSMAGASFPEAILEHAQIQGSFLSAIFAEGAVFDFANMQVTNMEGARLQGATFASAGLQASRVEVAFLHGSSFKDSFLQASSLTAARIQGASFSKANMQAARLVSVWAQGAWFRGADITHADLSAARLWMAYPAQCPTISDLSGLQFDEILDTDFGNTSADRVDLNAAEFVERAVEAVPAGVRGSLREKLTTAYRASDRDRIVDGYQRSWEACAKMTNNQNNDRYVQVVKIMLDLVCPSGPDQKHLARSLIEIWKDANPPGIGRGVARGLLERDGRACPTGSELGDRVRIGLQSLAHE